MNVTSKALCKYKKQVWKRILILKVIANNLNFRQRIQRVEIKTAGLIFRIFCDTVGQTDMM